MTVMAREAKGKSRSKSSTKSAIAPVETPAVAKSDMEVIIGRLSEIGNRRKVDALDALIKMTPPIGTPGAGKAAMKARLVADDLDASGDLMALLPTG